MWKMFDMMDAEFLMFECDECAGMPLAPPPQFLIPPPPRPPALAEYTVVPQDCNEEQMAQQQWESDVCQAMPILDASLYSSQSLATSAMIAVFSLLLVLIVLISSLFVWKNKRKVQNLLPCKTPTRGPLNGAVPLGGAAHSSHAAMYEDPDAHLGHHRPLVMRHHHHHPHHHHYQQHHHAEMLHGKSIHYPSGYPMTRSPPFLVSSSPGPDPYRSNDNVYEELGPGRVDSDGESEPPLHSDDDFAEDELSLPGECSFNKLNPTDVAAATPTATHSTPYHERAGGSGAAAAAVAAAAATTATVEIAAQPAPQERHSVLSSSSSTSTHDASTATAASSCNNNSNSNSNSHSSNNNDQERLPRAVATSHQDELNTSSSTADIADIAPLYDNRSNMMSLGYLPQQLQQQQQQQQQHPQQHPMTRSTAPQFYNTLESEVERRNRINAHLSQSAAPPVSTIFRERIHYPGSGRYQPQQAAYYASNSAQGLLAATMRARTNPRQLDRRLAHHLPAAHQHQHHRIHAAPLSGLEPAYGYAEPVYNANYFYDSAGARQPHTLAYASTNVATPAYIMPDYRQQGSMHPTQLYGRGGGGGGDSSFGSDSGYSHHTPASSIGRHDYDLAEPLPAPKATSKLSAALSFGWHRNRKQGTGNSGNSSLRSSSNEATSPNNNSACSTVTSQLEQCSQSSATSGNNNVNASLAEA
ncbi:transcriptional regulator MIT1 [Scaptodrosophila lebanonensis]|uniref:Transcriptional regulator MIT1 n=1 Tax=Drosophila lebanonensis TaxID=7225 RepID=A0A6J2TA78_DROLE|nr:transcriptional regulator MIT1 [Scaptodrosophila lebanonensis]